MDHSVRQLLAQRIYGLALGCEDVNDHAQLRRDPLLATACDKKDPLGEDRLIRAIGVWCQRLASQPIHNPSMRICKASGVRFR